MMLTNFADRLSGAILEKASPICVGLDPRVGSMPEHLLEHYRSRTPEGCGCGRHEVADCFEQFCAEIIEAVAPYAAAVKFQLACFEPYGPAGVKAFKKLCDRAAALGLVVIADAKRGDIGVSAAGYSSAYLGRPEGLSGRIKPFQIDALTVNPFFGTDGLEPFLDDCRDYGKGIFVLVKTSNPGSAELQDLVVMKDTGREAGSGGEPRKFHEQVAALVEKWGATLIGERGYSSVGAVVGATHPEDLAKLRRLLPHTPFLIPGYGAQGATAADVAAAFDSEGLGALITASRSIIYAGNGEDFAVRAAEAAERLQGELWRRGRGKP